MIIGFGSRNMKNDMKNERLGMKKTQQNKNPQTEKKIWSTVDGILIILGSKERREDSGLRITSPRPHSQKMQHLDICFKHAIYVYKVFFCKANLIELLLGPWFVYVHRK